MFMQREEPVHCEAGSYSYTWRIYFYSVCVVRVSTPVRSEYCVHWKTS